jgi:hypothetical protein
LVSDEQRKVSDLQSELRQAVVNKGYNLTSASHALGRGSNYITNMLSEGRVSAMRRVLVELEQLSPLSKHHTKITSKVDASQNPDELVAWIRTTVNELRIPYYMISRDMGYADSYVYKAISTKSVSRLLKVTTHLKKHYAEQINDTEQINEPKKFVRDGKTYVKIPLERVTSKSVLADNSKFIASFDGGFYSSQAVSGLSFQTAKSVSLDEASFLDKSNIVAFVENFTADRGEQPDIYQYTFASQPRTMTPTEQVMYIEEMLEKFGVKKTELSIFMGESRYYVTQAVSSRTRTKLDLIVKFIKSDISSPDPMVFKK